MSTLDLFTAPAVGGGEVLDLTTFTPTVKSREAVSTRDVGNGLHVATIRQFNNGRPIRNVISEAAESPGQAISDARARLRARLLELGNAE